jgi:hypothetical protein
MKPSDERATQLAVSGYTSVSAAAGLPVRLREIELPPAEAKAPAEDRRRTHIHCDLIRQSDLSDAGR